MKANLVYKDYYLEGFQVDPDLAAPPEYAKYFTDSRHKVLIDNTAPYGHFITNWLYVLLTELEKISTTPEDTLVLIFKSPEDPGSQLNHMSTVTEYVHDRLIQRGYGVSYVDSQYLYVTNYHHFSTPLISPPTFIAPVVGRFLAEGVTTSSYGRKIYLSRSKTTTSNGNKGVDFDSMVDRTVSMKENLDRIRTEKQYQFSDRIDDEAKLESYLKTLGFEILTPEDFDSYQDQLNQIAEAKILASVTSSALHAGLVLSPTARVVEFSTNMYSQVDSLGNFIEESGSIHSDYLLMAMTKNIPYTAIPNMSRKAQDIIDYIEANPDLKLLLAS